MIPQTRYSRRADSVHIAYQVLGDGDLDLIVSPGFVSHLQHSWEEPNLARFLRRLASFSRLIVFDKRGTGMSDREVDYREVERDGARRAAQWLADMLR